MIEKYNFHWKKEFYYNYPKKRDIFEKILSYIDKKSIINITGLRRTGKTTILKQLINYLISSKKIKRENILLFSFDEELKNIDEIILEYENLINKKIFETKNEKFYIFFDEIQKSDNFAEKLKYYYDNVKFIISGSSSIQIKKKIQESLAGRIYDFNVELLSFKEFLYFKERVELINKSTLFQTDLKNELELYIDRQFIDIINCNKLEIKDYLKSIIEKIIYIDIPQIFSIQYPDLLMKIIKIISSNPGLILDYESLSNDIKISRFTLSDYIGYLNKTFLIRKIYNYSKNVLKTEKKQKRVYPYITGLSLVFNPDLDISKKIENLIISNTLADFYWRTPQQNEIDMVLLKPKVLPVEIKYKTKIKSKEKNNMLLFCNKFNVDSGLFLLKDSFDSEKIIFRNIEYNINYNSISDFLLN